MTRGSIASTVYAVFIAVAMNVTYVGMFTTAFLIPADIWQIGFITIFEATLFALLLRLEKERWALMSLTVILIFAAVCFGFNFYYPRECIKRIYYRIRDVMFRDVAHGMGKNEFTNNKNVAALFIFINAVPTYFVVRMIQLRRHSFQAVVWTVPYWVMIIISRNDEVPSLVIAFGVTLFLFLIIYGSLRRAPAKELDITAGFVMAFLLIVTFGLCVIFPKTSYKKNKTADRILTTVTGFSDAHFNTHLSQINFNRMFNSGGAGDVFGGFKIKVFDSGISLTPDGTNLRDIGYFSPKDVVIMKVTLSVAYNSYFDWYSSQDRVFYLKSASMSTFKDDSWGRTDYEIPEFTESADINPADMYVFGGLNIVPRSTNDFYYVPNYAAPVIINKESHVTYGYKNGYPVTATYPYSDNLFADESIDKQLEVTSYSYYLYNNNDSNAAFPKWSEEYLNYVNNECLFVPEDVEKAILECNVLPDWYMQVYNKEITMTDEEKVKNVMDYLYNLRSYDRNTPFSPEDKEFVVWFLTESETGFCVHYATTAAVLLRMIDVPTRYTVGYLAGKLNPAEETTIYDGDSHAWCEYFDTKSGWVEFDPTLNRFVSANHTFEDLSVHDETEVESSTESADAVPENSESGVTHFELPEERIDPVAIKTQQEAAVTEHKEIDREKLDEIKNKELRLITLWRPIVKAVGYLLMIAFLAFIIIRLIYTVVTLRHMNSGNLNDRTRAYYRYLRRISGFYGRNPVQRAEDITDIAMYSLEGVDDKLFDEMKTIVKDSLEDAENHNSVLKKLLVQLVFVV
ncbi:MAG: transglutaminase-like domain-containing protein [Clostridia bacterium]|nr:transglutaminase-like domain-containing protein [Clostridia bacterium]